MTEQEITIQDYLKIVDNNIECGWYDEALEYIDRILKIDYKCEKAWILKAEVLDRTEQTSKAVATWLNALYFMEDETRKQYRDSLANTYWPNFFLKFNESLNQQRKEDDFPYLQLESCNDILNIFTVKGNIVYNRARIYSQIVQRMFESAQSHFEKNESAYGTTHKSRSKIRMNNFINSAGYCYHWMMKAASMMRDSSEMIDKLKWTVSALQKTLEAESWTYHVNSQAPDGYERDQMPDEQYKQKVNEAIERCQQVISQCESVSEELVIDELSRLREPDETARAIRYYWLEHEEEKDALIREKENLTNEIESLSERLATLDVLTQIEELHRKNLEQKDNLQQAQAQRNSLSIFDRKGKKEAQARIDEISAEIAQQEAQLSELQMQLQTQTVEITGEKEAASTRITRIDEEFRANRGRIEEETRYYIGDIRELTCRQICDNLLKLLPEQFNAKDASQTTLRLHSSLIDSYCFRTMLDNISTVLVFDCKTAEEIPGLIVLKHHSYDMLTKEEIMAMVRTGTPLLRSLVRDLSIADAEKMLVSVLTDEKDSTVKVGNLSLEYAYDFSNHCILFRAED